jgi:hypothetical protein
MTGAATYPGRPAWCRPPEPAKCFSNYDADTFIGATVSEIIARKSPSFIPATIEGSAGPAPHDGSAMAWHLT